MTNDILNNMKRVCSLYDVTTINITTLYKINNKHYIFDWFDIIDGCDYYNVFEVSIHDLNDYVNKQKPIISIYKNIKSYSNVKLEKSKFILISDNIPPTPFNSSIYTTYFNEDDCRDYFYIKEYVKNQINKERILKLRKLI